MNQTFEAWCPDDDDGTNAWRHECHDASTAAERYMERNFANWDYPDEAEVCVRDATGKVIQFTVEVCRDVSFSAFRRPERPLPPSQTNRKERT